MLTRFLPGLQTREDTLKRPELVLALLDEAYEKRTWHGPNLRQSIRGVTVKQAAWRPGRGRHNIWEVTVHAAYWKYAVRRRLEGGKRGSFALKGSNFFARPEKGKASDSAWRADQKLLEMEHRALRGGGGGKDSGDTPRSQRAATSLWGGVSRRLSRRADPAAPAPDAPLSAGTSHPVLRIGAGEAFGRGAGDRLCPEISEWRRCRRHRERDTQRHFPA